MELIIKKVKNGYILEDFRAQLEVTRYDECNVFENLDNLFVWLRENFKIAENKEE